MLRHLRHVIWIPVWRAIKLLAPLVVLLGMYLTWQAFFSSPPEGPVGVQIPPDESLMVAQIADNGVHIVNNTRNQVGDGVYRRDAHAKTQGCAIATFDVKHTFDSRLLYGLFGNAKTYKAWVRFSSGDFDIQNDWLPDARGMAIKVLGVPGRKLLEGEQEATTQDFLMINHPAFFIRNAEEYLTLTTWQSQEQKLRYFFGTFWNPFSWHVREFRIGLQLLGWPPRNLLSTRFYSMTAYRLGPAQFVKYSAKPVACAAGGDTPGWWPGFGASALHDGLAQQIKEGRFCFDFMAQLQANGPGLYMPVEDSTVTWKESDSPFVTVARLEIDKQDIDPAIKSGFCENLSFSPWHALPPHEPVGVMNRLRKVVYQNIARYRRCSNGKFFGEPADDGSQTFTTQACTPYEPVPNVQPGSRVD